jgi:hypothetical protein
LEGLGLDVMKVTESGLGVVEIGIEDASDGKRGGEGSGEDIDMA